MLLITATLLSLALGSSAIPTINKRWTMGEACMTDADAQQVVTNYANLIRAYTDELAVAALTPDFTDHSESVNSLIDTCPQGNASQARTIPLLEASFTSRKQFMVAQGQQPAINFEELNIEHNCNVVIVRWKTTNTAPIPKPRPVVGLILLEAEKAGRGSKYPWLISTVFSEFDSAAWLQNLEQAGICQVTSSESPAIILPSGSIAASTPESAAPTISSTIVPTSSAPPVVSSAAGSSLAAY